MFKKKEIELTHDLEMEKLEYIRKTELMILEKQWELANRPVAPQYPGKHMFVEDDVIAEDNPPTSQNKYRRKKKK